MLRKRNRRSSAALFGHQTIMELEAKSADAREMVETVYREESRRVFATLVRLLGDFDLAEEALHDAFASAVEQWPREGVPANPRAWLVSAGRFKAIDVMRRHALSGPIAVRPARAIGRGAAGNLSRFQ